MDNKIRMTQYKENSAPQTGAIICACEYLREMVSHMNLKNPERFINTSMAFTIADLGCSNGLNSIEPMKACIETVRSINPKMPICVYLDDTPLNDFSETNKNISNFLKEYKENKDVYVYFVSKSFYERLFSEESIDIMFSLSSTLWVRNTAEPHDAIMFYSDNSTKSNEIGKKWEEIAKNDWNLFLSLRKNELRKNGMIITSATVCQESFNETDKIMVGIFRTIMSTIYNFVEKYQIENKAKDFILPVVVRNKSELLKPFKNGDQVIGLEIWKYEEKDLPWPFHKQGLDDSEELSHISLKIVKFVEAICGSIIKHGLKINFDEEKIQTLYKEIFDNFYEKLQARVKEIVGAKFIITII